MDWYGTGAVLLSIFVQRCPNLRHLDVGENRIPSPAALLLLSRVALCSHVCSCWFFFVGVVSVAPVHHVVRTRVAPCLDVRCVLFCCFHWQFRGLLLGWCHQSIRAFVASLLKRKERRRGDHSFAASCQASVSRGDFFFAHLDVNCEFLFSMPRLYFESLGHVPRGSC